ncbi:MAG: copper oxidase [Geobacteraceae bacterium]|nr:copper oxidase [Geobacteraceae bacterium]
MKDAIGKFGRSFMLCAAIGLIAGIFPVPPPAAAAVCGRTITADVVAIDQPLMFNRLGAQNINGMAYVLRRDVINLDSGLPLTAGGAAVPGKVAIRPDKRPRPLVLRVAAGDCLQVNFQNLLAGAANPRQAPEEINNEPFNIQIDDQVADRFAGFHPQGMQLVGGINSDSSFVGQNANSLVPPGGSAVYSFFAEKEGTFLVQSYGASFGGEGSAGNSGTGLFGAVNVEPKLAKFYRSQVTDEELRLATRMEKKGKPKKTADGHPIINYEAKYPSDCPDGVWCKEGKAGLPILNMLNGTELVHTDINAIIAGPNADGTFPQSTYPLESVGKRNPTVPNRLEPFREFTTVFHDEMAVANAFNGFFEDPVFEHTLHGVRDGFMINYGSGGVGSEIIANRLGVGPMHDCLDCAYEEFFLTSHTVGDPAMIVDVPANVGLEALAPGAAPPAGTTGPKATMAFYPDDPSNVHHSYTNDFVKFRNVHSGKEHHIFHLHNHQWLFNANDDNSNYLDAQAIGPGSGYTYEINFGGSGNRNKTAGDAIFHCHFYPHFAQGMWELWRNHDVFEAGTRLAVSGSGFHNELFALQFGIPALHARALPDGEIVAGTPIPALVPLPGKPMAPMPGRVEVVANPNSTTASAFHPAAPGLPVPVGSLARVDRTDTDNALKDPTFNPTGLKNPGFPFWIAGIEHTVGQRPPTPPLDMFEAAGGWDGGLPRHSLDGFAAVGGRIASSDPHTPTPANATFFSVESRFDFSKEILKARPVFFPEAGTDVEKAVMFYHAGIKFHDTFRPNGTAATGTSGFRTNGSGAPGTPGAPYHEPCVDDRGVRLNAGVTGQFFDGAGGLGTTGSSPFNATSPRIYKAAVIQIDAVFNKAGYHYPQERIISLWEDVLPTINKQRPPEPFVIRNNTFDCTMFQHTNLVPKSFELDDYQVRTPTDIIGQHIHLPKWDLTTTDGSGNGWNYEDGTLSPGAVRERIEAINRFNETAATPVPTLDGRTTLEPLPHPFFGAGFGNEWLGARTTLQRWFFDPVVNVAGVDRGLGVIFSHDHYGPSTHQQVGLYATVMTEPAGSQWVHNETGVPLYTRADGGPTSWQAAILTGDNDGDGQNDSYREFWLMFSDFQHAYEKGVYVGAGPDGRPNGVEPSANTFRSAINPSVKQQVNPVFPDMVVLAAACPGGVPRPCPEAISADDPGMHVVNYRNEPIGLRVFDPNKLGPDFKLGSQTDGLAGDLAFALQSRADRALAPFNTRLGDTPYPALTADIGNGDPFTPMMRAYFGDRIRMKIQAGGDEETHNATVHGVKWLQSGSSFGFAPNSGWRNAQQAGISEQFTFAAPVLPLIRGANNADYAYSVDTSQDGWWSGMWGLARTYGAPRNDLFRLPNTRVPLTIANQNQFDGVCPRTAKLRNYDITAVLANDVLGDALGVTIIPGDASATQHVGGPLNADGGTLVYNPRNTSLSNGKQGPLHDPTAILYVRTADLDALGKLKPGVPVEPIVLRAAAGECINVTLRNKLPAVAPDLAGYNSLMPIVNRDRNDPQGVTTFNNNLIRPSSHVGLHPALVSYDITRDDGTLIGANPPGLALVPPGGSKNFQWYAGDLRLDPANRLVATPVGFGGANLGPADKIKQGQKGLVGALVVEPQGATWVEADLVTDHQTSDPNAKRLSRASATVNGTIRDFAAVLQKGLNHRYVDGTAVENIAAEGAIAEDSEDAGQMAINYGSEPLWFRFGLAPNVPFGGGHGGGPNLADVPNAHEAYSNNLAGVNGDPATPVFTATAGNPARMYVLMPTGVARSSVFNLHGHLWQRDPYVCPGSADLGLAGKCSSTEVASRALGSNPLAMYLGGQESVLPASHFDIVLPKAGGANSVTGDYLFRDQAGFGNLGGLWGIMRVH